MDDVAYELRQECRELAFEMVRLEQWAAEAYERVPFTHSSVARRRLLERVAELHTQRELAQERRSELLRDVWLNHNVRQSG